MPSDKHGRYQKLLALLVVVCVTGAGIAIYIGGTLFAGRSIIFKLFSAYVVLIAGVVLFFGYQLIKRWHSERSSRPEN